MKFLLVLIMNLALAAVVLAQPPGAVQARAYQVGPGDRISVKTLGEPEFSWDGWIDENGRFQLPGQAESIYATCMTEDELRTEVAKYVSKYLKSPQLSVFVSERKSRPPVTIYGEVRQPGPVQLTRRATLRELLAFAGGQTKEASGMVQVTRTQPVLCSESKDEDWKTLAENGVGFPSRLYSFSSLKNVNPEIFPGDIIDVQKASVVYVIGEVTKPGEVQIQEDGLRLLQALAMAGGTTREAKKKELTVIRRREGSAQPEILTVNYDTIKKGEKDDLVLQPNDIVEVGKAKKNFGDILYETLTGLPQKVPLPIRPF